MNRRTGGVKSGKETRDGLGTAASREDALYRQARWLLEHCAENIQKKHEQEEAMANAPRYTRNDALYKIAGLKAVQYDGDHVQSSNLSNAPLLAALTVDEVLLRMNQAVERELSKGYKELCRNVTLVNTALLMMDKDLRYAARQMYVKKIPLDSITSLDGHKYCKRTIIDMRRQAEKTMVEILEQEQELKALCSKSEEETNEYYAEEEYE